MLKFCQNNIKCILFIFVWIIVSILIVYCTVNYSNPSSGDRVSVDGGEDKKKFIEKNQVTKEVKENIDNLENNVIKSKDTGVQNFVLALGDSYTSGMAYGYKNSHSYVIKINELLKNDKFAYQVIQKGVAGETSAELRVRAQKDLIESLVKYKVVVIFTGINDFARSSDPTAISNSIISAYGVALDNGYKTVIVTIPETLWFNAIPALSLTRKNVNESIKTFYEKNKKEDDKKIYLCDLDEKINYNSWTESEKTKYINEKNKDFVHLTPDGYDYLGEIIYNCLKLALTE